MVKIEGVIVRGCGQDRGVRGCGHNRGVIVRGCGQDRGVIVRGCGQDRGVRLLCAELFNATLVTLLTV